MAETPHAALDQTAAAPGRRWPWLTVLLALALLACHLWQLRQGAALGLSGTTLLTELGANVAPLTVTGEYWRLPASIFLHESWEHLLQNVAVLLMVGCTLESLILKAPSRRTSNPQGEICISRSSYLFIFLASGLFAAWMSALVHFDYIEYPRFDALSAHLGAWPQRVIYVSVGASGAILGMAGAALALALGVLWKGQNTPQVRRLLRVAALLAALTLFYGMLDREVDNATHAAGFGFGLLAGVVLVWARHASRASAPLTGGFAAMALIGLISWAGYRGAQTNAGIQFIRQQALDMQTAETETVMQPPAVDEQTARGYAVPETFVVRVLADESPRRLHVLENGNQSEARDYDAAAHEILAAWARGPYPKKLSWAWGCLAPECLGVGVSDLRLAGGQAYLSNLVKGAVSRVDVTSGAIAYSTPTGPFPSRLLVHGGVVYVHDWAGATLTLLDADSGKVLKTVDLGSGADRFRAWPRGDTLALSQDQSKLYLLGPDHRVRIYDLAADALSVWMPAGPPRPPGPVAGDDPDKVRNMGVDGEGRVWLLHENSVSYPEKNLRGPSLIYKLRTQRDAPDVLDTYMNPDGKHPLILSVMGSYVAASSAVTGRLLRLYPLAFPSASVRMLSTLDKQRFYAAGLEGFQVFDVDLALAPSPAGDDYQRRLEQLRRRNGNGY
jgi:membrane associated rhomboid family serine protease